MVKLKGPIASLAAAGSIGKAVTVASWKGRSYMKKLTKPVNPKSGSQVGTRSMMRFLASGFGGLSAANILTWGDLAAELNVSNYNAWVSYNLERWARLLAPTKAFPATASGDPGEIDSATATALNRSIVLEYEGAEAFDDWGIIIFRSTSTGFTPGPDNVVRVNFWDQNEESDFTWTNGPLTPATYYYRAWTFSEDGNLDKLFTDEDSATIT